MLIGRKWFKISTRYPKRETMQSRNPMCPPGYHPPGYHHTGCMATLDYIFLCLLEESGSRYPQDIKREKLCNQETQCALLVITLPVITLPVITLPVITIQAAWQLLITYTYAYWEKVVQDIHKISKERNYAIKKPNVPSWLSPSWLSPSRLSPSWLSPYRLHGNS